MDAIHKLLARLVGYSIHSHDFNKRHYSLTWGEALEWAACYPADDFICIRRQSPFRALGQCVAIRG